MAQTIKHLVELYGDTNITHFRDNRSRFRTIRLVVHTTGAWPNSPLSDNHVSIYLLLETGGSVRANMATADDDTRGYLEWSLHGYQNSNTEILHMDYGLVAPMEIRQFYQLIRGQGFHRYQFSGGGSGCRYWHYVLLDYMTRSGWLNADVPGNAWTFLSKQYSRNSQAEPRQITVRQGTFLTYDNWLELWTEDEEE